MMRSGWHRLGTAASWALTNTNTLRAVKSGLWKIKNSRVGLGKVVMAVVAVLVVHRGWAGARFGALIINYGRRSGLFQT